MTELRMMARARRRILAMGIPNLTKADATQLARAYLRMVQNNNGRS